MTKDAIKEILFDKLGWQDRERSRELSVASYELLYYFMEVELQAGRSFIVESTFQPERDNPRLEALRRQYDFVPFQIQCVADGPTLYRRFVERAATGVRHPGHVDGLNFEEFKPVLLRGRYDPLDLNGSLIEVDTTDFTRVDYEALIAVVRAALNE